MNPAGSLQPHISAPYTFNLPMNRSMLMSSNERKHWTARHRITRYWREITHLLAKQAHIPKLDRVMIVVTFSFGDRRRRDVANFYPVSKAIVDGIVDAKIVDDDSDRYVLGPDARREDPGKPMIRVDLFPQAVMS